MKRGSVIFPRAVILLVVVGVLAGLLWVPQVEGRNANADQLTIYFRDPFLAYVYLGSLPFFFGLYQGSRCWAAWAGVRPSRPDGGGRARRASTGPWTASRATSSYRPDDTAMPAASPAPADAVPSLV